MTSSWREWAERETAVIHDAGRWRAPRDFDATGPEGKLAPDGRPVVSFASNDYFGLTQHPQVVAAARAALDRWGAGSGSARLIVGSRPVHSELEAALAAWKGEEAAVLFPTGFAANLGAITAFAGTGVFVASDELNHASIIDACRLARATTAVFPHRDIAALDALLTERREQRLAVVTDTVFSMDGDTTDVDALVDVCARHDALLIVDEAHAALGPHPDLSPIAHLRVGTLSKMLGALGGFVAGSRPFVDLIVNRARSYIFTTAPTPADTAAALAAVRVMQSNEGDALVARLQALVEMVRPGHPSPIIPFMCGDEQRALDAAAALLERGVLVPAIRPPTVAPGTSRLRVALSAAHTDAQVALLLDSLRDLALA
ncbi:MAG: 7-keto-8-aminopelargonate synthetase-like enzyme [Actinomycetia bacterium]|nr:7-keto-8-aminopelargonate synthetase-like enzyme [Actinomycetes bacterium]